MNKSFESIKAAVSDILLIDSFSDPMDPQFENTNIQENAITPERNTDEAFIFYDVGFDFKPVAVIEDKEHC